MRIRVTLDVTKPLLRKRKLNISLQELVWVNFKCECMLDFCFYCGVIGHGHKECKIWLVASELYEAEGLPYGNFLCVGFIGGNDGPSKQCISAQSSCSSSPAVPTKPLPHIVNSRLEDAN